LNVGHRTHYRALTSEVPFNKLNMSKSGLQLLDDLIAELENAVQSSSVPAPSSSTNKPPKSQAAAKDKTKADASSAPAKGAEQQGVKDAITINAIDLRVGIIRKVCKHETAEKLYCEEIDVGEDAPRAIASGLVPYYSLDQMQDRKLIVVCNLKARNLVGFKSHGMVLCASKVDADGTHRVEFVDPPAGSKPGDRIVAEGIPKIDPFTPSKCDKSKAFEVVAPDLKVDHEGVANWQGHRLICLTNGGTGAESCIAPTLRDANVA
jgi:aminoacyl tRNA synthase complex-interacting multifunctional protein 1